MNDYVSLYTDAIYSLGTEEDMTDAFLSDMKAVQSVLSENKDYIALLDAPTVETDERVSLIDKAFRGQVGVYILNFMKVLTEKRRMYLFSQCLDAFTARYNSEHNIVPVQAITAAPLPEELLAKLKEKTEASLGKTVILTNIVDASCLGGVILRYENKQLDGSVRTRLETIRKQLTDVV